MPMRRRLKIGRLTQNQARRNRVRYGVLNFHDTFNNVEMEVDVNFFHIGNRRYFFFKSVSFFAEFFERLFFFFFLFRILNATILVRKSKEYKNIRGKSICYVSLNGVNFPVKKT